MKTRRPRYSAQLYANNVHFALSSLHFRPEQVLRQTNPFRVFRVLGDWVR
jgi:hypothetical protein